MVLVQTLMSQILRSTATDNTPTEFWDLFCGIGGASTGAAMAGLAVRFACDASEGALETHAHNHPSAMHRCLQLPASDKQLMLPTDGRAFWIHGSPPCTQLSITQMRPDAQKVEEALGLVQWYLDLAARVSPHNWSMEQVANPQIVKMLYATRRANRMVDYIVVDFAELGVPQHRRRVLAGPPHVIDRVRAFRS